MPLQQATEAPPPFRAPYGRAPWWWVSTILILALAWAVFTIYPVQKWMGFISMPLWDDARAVLASIDGHRDGVDIYHDNIYNTHHLYSSIWFQLGDLGLSRRDQTAFALAHVFIFLIPALLLLRPANRRESLWLLAFFSSSPVLLGLYRANSDLIIFGLLALVIPCLRSHSRLVRSLAPLLIVFAAALKYYPLIGACVLFVEPDKRRRRWLLLVFAAAAALALAAIWRDFEHISSEAQASGVMVSMGARLLLTILGVPPGAALLLGLCGGTAVACAAWFWRSGEAWLRSVEGDWRTPAFMLSAALFAGCYWTGGSWSYRLIMLYGMIPFFVAPPRPELMPAGLERLTRWMPWLLVFILSSQTVMAVMNCILSNWLSLGTLMQIWVCLSHVLHVCYLPLALYCTVLVANMVFTRLREGL